MLVVYNIGYHIVWLVKYRRKLLIGIIEASSKEVLFEVAQGKYLLIKEIII